jgi:hypothetical protein
MKDLFGKHPHLTCVRAPLTGQRTYALFPEALQIPPQRPLGDLQALSYRFSVFLFFLKAKVII